MIVFVLKTALITSEGSVTRVHVFHSYKGAKTTLDNIKKYYEDLRESQNGINISTLEKDMFMVSIEETSKDDGKVITTHKRYSIEGHELLYGYADIKYGL